MSEQKPQVSHCQPPKQQVFEATGTYNPPQIATCPPAKQYQT